MLVSFRLEQEEYKNFTKFALKQASGKKNEKKSFLVNFVIWFLVAIVFMSIFQTIGKTDFNFDLSTAIIVILPILVGIGVYFYEMQKVQKNTLPKTDGFLLSESTIELRDDGIHATKEYATSFFNWKSVESVSENNGDFYLFLDNVYAIIIPNSAFTSSKQADEFRRLIEMYV